MLSGARPRFSLIIPARNEEAYLPHLLDTVDAARSRYQAGPDAVEVIVSDNGSTDATAPSRKPAAAGSRRPTSGGSAPCATRARGSPGVRSFASWTRTAASTSRLST
ncbi:MAG: glycosyltransferase [Gemmatimonadetes bacterium]|nr:glycosyltransferase [Gemmatimonadota bacterium]